MSTISVHLPDSLQQQLRALAERDGISIDQFIATAVAARCDFLVTYNIRDFVSVERFALQAIEPGAFLRYIGALP